MKSPLLQGLNVFIQPPAPRAPQTIWESLAEYQASFERCYHSEYGIRNCTQEDYIKALVLKASWFYLGLQPRLRQAFSPCVHLSYQEVVALAQEANSLLIRRRVVGVRNRRVWGLTITTEPLIFLGDACTRCERTDASRIIDLLERYRLLLY